MTNKSSLRLHEATLGEDGISLLDGIWYGPGEVPSDFWVGVKAEVYEESLFGLDTAGPEHCVGMNRRGLWRSDQGRMMNW